MLQYSNMNYQGNQLDSDQDISNMEYIYLDVWTANMTDLEISLINNTTGGATEAPVTIPLTLDDWTSVQIPISDYTDQGLAVDQIFQLKLVDPNNSSGTVFIDNLYFWKSPPAASGIEGIWQIAPEAGALKVGPAPKSDQWWSNSLADVTTRACYFDDNYVFNSDGSFQNILGSETWLEGWQTGTDDACGAPISPHDGSSSSSYTYDENTGQLTLLGTGAYLGLPKAVNAGELPSVAVPSSVTYETTLTNNNTEMIVVIEAGTGVFWTYKLIK